MSDTASATVAPLRERVAEEIRVLLARRRWSESELARRAGFKQPYLWRRMTGDVPFDVDDLEKIATVLDTSPAEIFTSAATAGNGHSKPRYRGPAKRPGHSTDGRDVTRPSNRGNRGPGAHASTRPGMPARPAPLTRSSR